jgi:hypothetical protein
VPAGIEIGLAHAQWSDWDASESRAWAMVFGELGAVELGAGLAVRSPAAGTDVFVLSGPAAELNLLYRAEWAFAQDSRKAVSVWVSNLSENDMHTPQQVPFGAAGTFRLAERWSLGARAGTGIKGLSALLLSFGDITTRVGVTYEQ